MFFLPLFKKYKLVLTISCILFIVPFFWFKPGGMDLGGDGTRLYFYDPLAFIKNVSLYSLAPEGKADINPGYHAYLPYVGLLAAIKYFVHSSHQLINIFNGIKLSIGFISIYFIVKEFIQGEKRKEMFSVELPAIIAGIFYILATGSEKLIFFWTKALHSHDQIFLNPLMFLLLLRYLLTQNRWYLWSFILMSTLFSTSFAMFSSPPFFAFYPIALFFLLIYVIFVRKRKILFKEIVIGLFLFFGLHSFHLIPEIMTLFDKGSVGASVVFKVSGINYFMAIHGLGKVSTSFLTPSPVMLLRWTSFIGPLVIILGYLLHREKRKEMLLTSFFFLITLFLVSANITAIGLALYQQLFNIPGFSMFRNFFVQWAYVFIFFYALLFGQSLAIIFKRLKLKYAKITAVGIIVIFIIGFWPFLTGELVDGIQWGSNGVKTAMVMDPRYEQTLGFIRKLPDEGKFLILPLTDNYIQVIFGMNNAAYVGPSSISFLTPKKSFAGYQNFWPNPIPETIMRFAREKNYEGLTQIFSLFNIRYIFHNTDPKIYEEKFPEFPNSYMMTSLPKTQKEYKEFVKNFPVKLIYNNGPYEIFGLDKKVYRAEVYVPDSVYKEDMVKIIGNQNVSYQSAFIDSEMCQKNKTVLDFCNTTYQPPKADIRIEKIKPTQYKLHVKQSEDKSPFLLVFQNSFHPGWKLSFEDAIPIDEARHVLVNKYANGWIISNDDRKGRFVYTLNLTLETQRYFEYGVTITSISAVILIGLVMLSLFNRREKN